MTTMTTREPALFPTFHIPFVPHHTFSDLGKSWEYKLGAVCQDEDLLRQC